MPLGRQYRAGSAPPARNDAVVTAPPPPLRDARRVPADGGGLEQVQDREHEVLVAGEPPGVRPPWGSGAEIKGPSGLGLHVASCCPACSS